MLMSGLLSEPALFGTKPKTVEVGKFKDEYRVDAVELEVVRPGEIAAVFG